MMTDNQIKEFEIAARPLIKWLAENVNPRHYALVDRAGAELVNANGENVVNVKYDLRD